MGFPFKRVAKSLDTLKAQIDAMAPGRSRASDGTLGDASHQTRPSDHNPNEDGIVTAIDITHDPAHGVNAGAIAEQLRISRDPRIKYVISNARIFSSPGFSTRKTPWEWRPYDGPNAHTKHFHLSVLGDPKLYDDTSPWPIAPMVSVRERPAIGGARRSTGIIATVFGGAMDHETSAYDMHVIGDQELGVALPFHFSGARPKVRVINPMTNASVECDIVDVGPWNTNDPYWQGSGKPEAETRGVASDGRRTNGAGIDLTPAAARAVGIDGKGRVDWEFVGAAAGGPLVTVPTIDPGVIDPGVLALRQRIDQLEQLLRSVVRGGGAVIPGSGTTPVPRTQTPAAEIPALLQQVLAIVQDIDPQATTPNDRLRRAIEIINTILTASGKPLPLGQVNGALGQTIGNLLNGKKSAIGIIGGVASAILPALTSAGFPATILGASTAAIPQVAVPLFIGMTVWGFLGKIEKWAQGTAPLPKLQK